MDAIEALSRSIEEFQGRLDQVQEEDWDKPTPCPNWSVRDLVNHMFLGTRMTVQLLAGGSRDDVIAGLGDNLLDGSDDISADFATLAEEMRRGFSAPSGLEGTVDHPMGEIPRTMFIGFRVLDDTVHSWDLARGIGANDELDAEVIGFLWNEIQPMAGGIKDLGIFGDGASGNVGEDAPLQQRYLDLLGRRP